ncbi:MAG: maleate cis-trans isomerase family protein, partial [Planctomycetia bacterium]
PDANAPPMPALSPPGVIYDGVKAEEFGGIDSSRGYPDVRSFRRKFGLLIPATNTSMEHELWGIIFNNQGPGALAGVGLHTTPILTPRPKLATEEDLAEYRKQFLGGVRGAIEAARLAEPQYFIMGMSLEHLLPGIEPIRAAMGDIERQSELSWATWHDAAYAALTKFKAKRIGLLTPFDAAGNRNAARMFAELGFEVAASVGFSCANALHIAHVPDWAKERAIIELLATDKNRLDAIVQCGTNMSLSHVTERLEPMVGIPILGINAVTFWYALRENGFTMPLTGAGRLLREH